LIVLEIRKRTVQSQRCFARPKQETRLGRRASIPFSDRKDQFCFKHIRDLCGQAQITTGMLSFPDPTMDLEFPPNRASSPGETGCASSSRCQIVFKRPAIRCRSRDISSRREPHTPPLIEDRPTPPSPKALADRCDPQTC